MVVAKSGTRQRSTYLLASCQPGLGSERPENLLRAGSSRQGQPTLTPPCEGNARQFVVLRRWLLTGQILLRWIGNDVVMPNIGVEQYLEALVAAAR